MIKLTIEWQVQQQTTDGTTLKEVMSVLPAHVLIVSDTAIFCSFVKVYPPAYKQTGLSDTVFQSESLSYAFMSKQPPSKSTGILSDIRFFFLDKPEAETNIKFRGEEDRLLYTQSILQRTGIGVEDYKMLNIHRIGIEAPATFVFEELLRWNGDSSCWPNHFAKVALQDGQLEHIKVSLFGWPADPFAQKKGFSCLHLFQIFSLKAIKIQYTPAPFDFDNARYLLYTCSGGYPIGVFSMYVRSSIPERGEQEMSQLFIMVGFNFYGNKTFTKLNIINKAWEAIHNRVTDHIMNRFKQLCEWRFEKFLF